jgi:hypothetical protein
MSIGRKKLDLINVHTARESPSNDGVKSSSLSKIIFFGVLNHTAITAVVVGELFAIIQ